MKNIIILMFFILTANENLLAQHNKNLMFIDNEAPRINPEAKYLVNVRAREFNEKVYFSWSTISDTVPGYYFIYKSINFKNIKLVSIVKAVDQVKPDVVIGNSVDDDLEFPYNFYHLVRINSNQNIDINDNSIKYVSVANVELEHLNNNKINNNNYTLINQQDKLVSIDKK